MYYNSILEIATWIVGLLCFFSYPSQIGFIWLHIFHVGRGVFGIYLVFWRSPKTFELIESISDFTDEQLNEHWGFEQMSQHVRDNFKKHFLKILGQYQLFFLIYFLVS